MGDGTNGTTRLTPERARDVGRTMRSGAAQLATSDFHRSTLGDGHFGGVERARVLAGEYALTYADVTTSMQRFESDLDGYSTAVVKSAEGLENTDADSAEVVRRIAGIVLPSGTGFHADNVTPGGL